MSRTMKSLAQETLDVQDACNMSGVARSFCDTMRELRDLLPNASTREINNHPITRMWASKIHDLSGMSSDYTPVFGEAYRWCKKTAEQEGE